MKKRKRLLQRGIALLTVLCLSGLAQASTLVQQTALPGDCIPKFAVPMPVFGPAGPIKRVNAGLHPLLNVTMKEIDQTVLPDPAAVTYPTTYGTGQVCPNIAFGKTRVWTYETSDMLTRRVLGPANWPAVTVEARRIIPTIVKYVNELPSFNPLDPYGPGLVQGLVSVDQTIHWADPLNSPMMNPCMDNPAGNCSQPYTGTPPAVVHLHGGEVSSLYDGGPLAWFTPDGRTGPGYSSLWKTGPGEAVYYYPNLQEPGTLWFHDHALGATRTNVYSGMAAFYFLRDPDREPEDLPGGSHEIEMAIQDRQFDTSSQLFFPDGSGADAMTSNLNGTPPNPGIHPLWIPEFFGDVAVVNGAPWPYLTVEPRRYRFHLLDGSNARFYNLNFGAAPVYVIGADDNYLNAPVPVSTVFIAPGERADVIVDFTGLAGQTITVTNNAPTPFPEGAVPLGGLAQVMQFRVSGTPVKDESCNPAAGGCTRPKPVVRLTDGQGNLAPGVKIDKVRQLVLNEVEFVPGAPLEVLLNNSKWDGLRSPSVAAAFPANGVSELPRQGSTELWEIINLTADAHPMHTHLTQFQILNRQNYDMNGYLAAWSAAFPADPGFNPACTGNGVYCPGYGPPYAYSTPNADGAIGGNPAVSPYLTMGNPTAPAPEESGWKETAKVNPGQVLRLVVRFTPTSAKVRPDRSYAGLNLYPFDPTQGDGYVWHCHIIDHEDNEMMRPFSVTR